MTFGTADLPVAGNVSGTVDFYREHGASAIMRAAHFPDEVLSFFQLESLAVLEAVSRYGCAVLVELGCYDGRSLEIARVAGVHYVGVDVNADAVAVVRRRIADEGIGHRARAVVGDAMRCEDWIGQVPSGRPLLLLPFNLLGNFADPATSLRTVRRVGGIAVLSVFTPSPTATIVRREYYQACGISPLEEVPGPFGGVVFRNGAGFRSQSFDPAALAELSTGIGVSVLSETSNIVGHCLTVCLD